MRKIFLSLFLLAIIFVEGSSYAQTLSLPGDGKDFFVGYMYPSYNKVGNASTDGFYGAFVLISSYTDNHVTVSYFDKQSGVEIPGQRFSIPARTGIQIQMSRINVQMDDSGDSVEYGACHITAARAIKVEFFSTGACSGGSFLPITTVGLGKKYVVASYNDNPGTGGLLGGYLGPSSLENSHGFFEIVAPYDGTLVTITPNATTMGGHRGVNSGANSTGVPLSYSVSLKRGQCYLVKSGSNFASDDISGSIVESNKPIAVLGGHENAFLGGVSGKALEGRDFMIEQMIPVDYWDTTGYVSIPLKDSQPQDPSLYEGIGENYRVYTYDSLGSTVQLYDQCYANPINMSVARYAHPAQERSGVTCPVDFETTNGKKFSVMMYDQRNFATSYPYPAPSMMTIIPMSHWKTSYLWYVPANKFETLQGYYVNIIAPNGDFDGINGIQGSYNGGTIKPIKTVINLEAQFKQIPNHPELTGVRFKLYPGSYYATGPHPFIVYNYGFRGLDPNFDLGDFDGDDFFFSYAAPAGMKMGNGQAHMKVKVDTSCSSWNVCIHDSTFSLNGQGIKSIFLLDDPTGDLVKPGYQYHNVRLDDSLDPGYPGFNTNEINFTGDDSDVCFKVLVNKPIDSAFAPLFIVDGQGSAILFQLKYKPPLVSLSPDTGRYLKVFLPSDSCNKYIFHNNNNPIAVVVTDSITGKPLMGKNGKDSTILVPGAPFNLTSANLLHHNPTFNVTSIVPKLPASIKAGDSLVITACFTPKDTSLQRDTIMLISGDGTCFKQPIDLAGQATVPLIAAGNRDFGLVIVDSTKCDTVSVRNNGNAPLILTSGFILSNTINFRFTDSARLPIKLNPGQVIFLTFCYTPHQEGFDTAIFYWSTNEVAPYKRSIKDSTILNGGGVKTGFIWDRTAQTMYADSTITNDSIITRVFLVNSSFPGGPPAHIDSVRFAVRYAAPDASEFYILANQLHPGSGTFGNFDLKAGDSIWVDVVFKPNTMKPYPQRYADRHADLVASDSVNKPPEIAVQKDQVIHFTGTWIFSDVKTVVTPPSFTIIPNPASGNSVIVSLNSDQASKAKLSLYDVLGREVYHKEIAIGISAAQIPISTLPTGIYFVRLLTDKATITQKLEISR